MRIAHKAELTEVIPGFPLLRVTKHCEAKEMNSFKVGDKVAWNMIDGNVMAGEVYFIGYDNYNIKRVDGGVCTIHKSRVRAATPEDVLAAVAFFGRIGK